MFLIEKSHTFGTKNSTRILREYNNLIKEVQAAVEAAGAVHSGHIGTIFRDTFGSKKYAWLSNIAAIESTKPYSYKVVLRKLCPTPKCPQCGERYEWNRGNKRLKPCMPCCSKVCANLIKYGVDNPAKTKVVIDKIQAAFAERFAGGHPQRDPEVIARKRQTNLERYGVEETLASKEVRELGMATIRERYNADHPLRSPEILAKVQATNLVRYGGTAPAKDPAVVEKARQTNLSKRQVEWTSQDPTVRASQLATLMARYNVDNPMKYPAIVEKCWNTSVGNHGGVYHTRCKEVKSKAIETSRLRYGTDHPTQNPDIFKKIMKSQYRIKTLTYRRRIIECQGWEDVILVALLKRYGSKDVFSQFDKGYSKEASKKLNLYPDIWVKSYDTYVEVKSTYTLLGKGSKHDSFKANRKNARDYLRQGIKCIYAVVLDHKAGAYITLPADWHTWTKRKLRNFIDTCPRKQISSSKRAVA